MLCYWQKQGKKGTVVKESGYPRHQAKRDIFPRNVYTRKDSSFLSLRLPFEPTVRATGLGFCTGCTLERRENRCRQLARGKKEREERQTNCFSVHVVALSPSPAPYRNPPTCLLQRQGRGLKHFGCRIHRKSRSRNFVCGLASGRSVNSPRRKGIIAF